MPFNLEILKDKNIAPMTAPDGAGKTRRLGIAPNTFGDDCETIEFKYVAGKGEFLVFNADIKTYEMIMGELEVALRKRDPVELTFEQTFKNKPSSFITVGRKDDGVPFIRIKATTKQGTERHKEFFFPMPRNINILRGGQPLNDLEKQERSCRAFLKTQRVFLDALEMQYKARVWQQNGGGYGGGQGGGYGGGQQGGQQGGYGQQQQRQQQPAQADSTFEDMF